MFKRANKVTALLVAAASILSVVPAMAADSTRLGTKDGTIEKAIAFDGKYIYEGYKGDADKAVYFNGGEKDKELTDFEDYTFTTGTYGEKYAIAEDGTGVDDAYLVDLTNGSITEDTLGDKLDSTASKLEKALKKTDKYDGQSVTSSDLQGKQLVNYTSFANPWYSFVTTATNANKTIFTDENGKYIDATVLANIYAYSSEKEKIVKVEKFGKSYSDTELRVDLDTTYGVKGLNVIAQDKDYIYAIARVNITDSSAKIKSGSTYETFTLTTSAAVTVDGTSYSTSDALYTGITGIATITANYDVTKTNTSVTLKAKTAGAVSGASDINSRISVINSSDKNRVAGSTTGSTYQAYYLQKISKAQGDTDEKAFEPKTVASYQIDNKSLYDNGDVSDAYSWLITNTDTTVNVEVKDNALYVYKKNSAGDNIKVNKLNLKQIKENPIHKDTTAEFGTTKLDGYVVAKDGDTDQDFDAYDVDSNGILWILNSGKIIKFAEKDKTTVYTCDSGFDKLDVYDEKNLVAWNEDDERYTTVSEGTAQTQSEAAVVAPVAPVTGWVKNADGTWAFNDYSGVKVASKWINDKGTWYYLKADGIMATGWYNDNGTWYYLNPASGAMATGWLNDNGTWYYLAGSGAMLANTTVDGYVLGANGAWVK